MGPDGCCALGGIDKVGVRGAEAGVVGEVIGIVIGVDTVIGGARPIVGGDQTIKLVIAIGPAVGGASVEPKGLWKKKVGCLELQNHRNGRF
jgi:hypothetical protein